MNKNLVINASPIILLGKADLLKTISPLAKTWIIPEGVIHEVQAKRPLEPYLFGLASNSEVVQKTVLNMNPSVVAWDLGKEKARF